MATVVPFNRRTRASCTSDSSPQRARSPDTVGVQRSAKRLIVFPADESSPAKRLRIASSDDDSVENSPVKVSTRSFYSGGKGRYLSPLERKQLKALRKNNLPLSDVKSEPSPNEKILSPVRPKGKNQAKPPLKNKSATPKTEPKRKQSIALDTKSLREIIPGSSRSPVKNRIKTEERRVYSPSRSGGKFFKSRRVSGTSCQPAASIQKNNLHLKYQPKAVVTKSNARTGKPMLLSKSIKPSTAARRASLFPKGSVKYLPVQSSPSRLRTIEVSAESPAKNTRSSPRKTAFKDSQSSGRSTIASSKNPNSQNLFSLSDWDFDDDEVAAPPKSKADDVIQVRAVVSKLEALNESTKAVLIDSVDSGQASRDSVGSTVSLAGDSIAVLSEFSEDKSVSPGSASDQSLSGTDPAAKSPSNKVYSIFKTRGLDQNPSSSPSTPRSAVYGLRLDSFRRQRNSPRMNNSPKLRSLMDKMGKEQLTLDFGQKLKGAVQCSTCGMTYNHGQPSDEALHLKFHDRLLAALKFPGWKNEHVLQQFMDGSRIIVVMPDEKQSMKKVATVKRIVDEDLGFVVDSPILKSNNKTFLYISEDKRVIGFCIAEAISSAYRVVARRSRTQSVGSQSQGDGSQGAESSTKPWCCSTSPEKARCGINRIWVLRSERRHGTASKLLDCVTVNFLLGFPLKRKDLAFTDPTPDGRAFAMRYTGTPRFLVYKHRA